MEKRELRISRRTLSLARRGLAGAGICPGFLFHELAATVRPRLVVQASSSSRCPLLMRCRRFLTPIICAAL
jgi:hypothetical protein